jgi:hypothetical protein
MTNEKITPKDNKTILKMMPASSEFREKIKVRNGNIDDCIAYNGRRCVEDGGRLQDRGSDAG